MKKLFILTFSVISSLFVYAQISEEEKLVSGPMQGHTTANTTAIWIMVKNTDSVLMTLKNTKTGSSHTKTIETKNIQPYKEIYPVTLHFENLEPETPYEVSLKLDNKELRKTFTITTLKTSGVADFSFMVGSCALWVPRGLRWMHPGIEERIYPHMKKAEGAFMLWLGDYLYYFPKHYKSPEGMYKQQVATRKHNLHMDFMRSRPQYAIWDDHEYGPNDSDKDFIYKNQSLELHKKFWPNPYYGEPDNPGCYFHFSYQDADFFMTDGRFYRSPRNTPNAEMLGEKQLQWLMDKLKNSTATFKFVAFGSQVLNNKSANESYNLFPEEKKKLMDFLEAEKITGVIFFSGDRHHTELIKINRENAYPLYDFTSSAITSFRRRTRRSAERENADRIAGTLTDKQNYGRVAISGAAGNRVCTLYTYNNRGKLEWEYKISENDLKFFKQQ
jgi:alkaline phosphatase D